MIKSVFKLNLTDGDLHCIHIKTLNMMIADRGHRCRSPRLIKLRDLEIKHAHAERYQLRYAVAITK